MVLRAFGPINSYKRHGFILEAKQGREADCADKEEVELDMFGQSESAYL